jgi:hypothetical protein
VGEEEGFGPEAEEGLCDAIQDAYDHASFRRLLHFRCGKRLDAIANSPNFPATVFDVYLDAKEKGWLRKKLVPAALAGNPENLKLKEWADKYGHVGSSAHAAKPSTPRPAWQLMDSAYFDLKEIRLRIREAMRATPGQVVGFGVTDPESNFVSKLTDWLRHHAGYAEVKRPLWLSPIASNPGEWRRQLLGYREQLKISNVLCQVNVDSAVSEQALTDFWAGVCQDFNAAAERLILVFTGVRPRYPAGITMLPAPQFKQIDVEEWAETVVSRRGWEQDVTAIWATWLCQQAADDGQSEALNVRRLYEAMDDSVEKFTQTSPDEFRAWLQDRMRP